MYYLCIIIVTMKPHYHIRWKKADGLDNNNPAADDSLRLLARIIATAYLEDQAASANNRRDSLTDKPELQNKGQKNGDS